MVTSYDAFNNVLSTTYNYNPGDTILTNGNHDYKFISQGWWGKLQTGLFKLFGYKILTDSAFANEISIMVQQFLRDPRNSSNTAHKQEIAIAVNRLYTNMGQDPAYSIRPALRAIGIHFEQRQPPEPEVESAVRPPRAEINIPIGHDSVLAAYNVMQHVLGLPKLGQGQAILSLYGQLKDGLTALYKGTLTEDEISDCLNMVCNMYAKKLTEETYGINEPVEGRRHILQSMSYALNRAIYDKVFWNSVNTLIRQGVGLENAISQVHNAIKLNEQYSKKWESPAYTAGHRNDPAPGVDIRDMESHDPSTYTFSNEPSSEITQKEVYRHLKVGTMPIHDCLPIKLQSPNTKRER